MVLSMTCLGCEYRQVCEGDPQKADYCPIFEEVFMAGFDKQVGFAKKVLEMVEAEGPRNRDGELLGRWRYWASALRKDLHWAERIDLTEKGREATDGGG